MIKNLLCISILIGYSVYTYAQEGAENSYILFCNSNQSEFLFSDVKNCNEVSVRDSEFKVASFVFKTKKKKSFVKIAIEGNQLTEECFAAIEKLKDPKSFYIEKVVDADGTPVEGFRQIFVTD